MVLSHGHAGVGDGPTIDVRESASPAIDVRSLDLGGDAVIVTDREGIIVDVNDAFVEVTGYSRREALGQTPRLLSSGFQTQEFYENLWQSILRGEVWQGELIDRRRDGSLRTYHSTISPVKDVAGRITHFVAVQRDLTGDLARQASLGSTGLVHTDLTGSCVYADERAATLLGATPTDLLGQGLTDLLEPDDAAELREVVGLTADRGRSHRLDVRARGGERWLHVEFAPLTVPSGLVIGTAGAIEDYSEQLAVHRELGRRDAFLDSVLDALPDAVAVAAGDGTVLAVNRAWREDHRADPHDAVLAARVGDDIETQAQRGADRGDERATNLLAELRRLRTIGADAGTARRGDHEHGGYAVTPLAWDEGGYVLRRLPA